MCSRVGELRFRPPQPKVSWEGEYNATYCTSICIQPPNPFLPIEGKQDEDCLFLNVYAPKTTTQSRKLPVMVWIHGGALVVGSGSGDFYDGTVLAAVGDVVVVTFNYRLGALGFLVTGDEHATGNYGLYDQIAALQWVQTNIEAFGGDPNKVTVFGESAGSISAEFLLSSPLTDGLFHRVILQSGTATMAGFTGSDSTFHNTIAHGLGKIVGCEKDTSDELVACLRSVEADDFRNSSDMSLGLIANVTGLGEELTGLPFPPFVDDKLIKQHPVDTIREKAFTKTNVDIMIGAMAAEGAVFLPMAMSHMVNESEISLNRSEYEAMYPMFVTGPVKQNTVGISAIKLMYVNWEDADLQDGDYIDALVLMIGDENFICPMDLSARAYAQSGAKVYLYHMTHTPANSIWRIKWMGPAHAEDIPFVFGWHFFHGANWTMPPEEVEMSLSIMKYWTNFAKTGNPNCQSDDETHSQGDTEREWPLYQVPELAYKELSLKMETKRALKAKECAFWNDFVPKLLEEYGSIGKCLGNEDEEKKYTEERH